jgi:hypothetical protein
MLRPARLTWFACGRILLLSLFLDWSTAHAHDTGSSYLILNVHADHIAGRWEIGLHDLDEVLKLDADRNNAVSRDELRAGFPSITNYAVSHLKLTADGMLRILQITDTEPVVETSSKGTNVVLNFVAEETAQPKVLELDYRLFFEVKPQHRGLLLLECNGLTQTAMFSPDRPTQRFKLTARSPTKEFLSFGGEGVWHIWIGIDHILFLLALLLPAVLQREAAQWRPVHRFRDAFVNVFKIVTAFTVAHSLTLSLATLQVIKLSSKWVESAIAASVLLAAANNVRPFFRGRAWVVAFAFGLIHGFGFANVLTELGLPRNVLLLALVGFNLGVEVGQLAIVAVFLPVAYGLRGTWLYQNLLLRIGSWLIVGIAGIWMLERMFDLNLISPVHP